jgi:hypothetical protein
MSKKLVKVAVLLDSTNTEATGEKPFRHGHPPMLDL